MMNDKSYIYLRISENIEHKIKNEVFKIGDRLPSIRNVCNEYGVSMSTALSAYYSLESKGLIEARPKSGYYVCYSHSNFPTTPETSKPNNQLQNDTENLISRVYGDIEKKDTIQLSIGVPSSELLPVAKVKKALIQAANDLPSAGLSYENVQGNSKLRRQVAKWSYTWEGKLTEEDIVTSLGCMGAVSYSLSALTKPGDTIVVESPVYFGLLQLAKSLMLNVIELPTHPITGVELDELKKLFAKKKVSLCLFVTNFSNPLGSCMPEENKIELVRLLEKYNIPLIEDDLYGDVYFGKHRPKSCKTYDESGMVLWCGSVSKTLAPGYRVGWVAPGKFKDKILQTKLYHSVSSTTIIQEAIGNFLENGRYENHLQKLRQTLYTNSLQYLRAISEYFPDDTKVSRPQGGFLLWVELNPKIDTVEFYNLALKNGISIAPGKMFTLQNQFNNCIRLSYGMPWSDQLNQAIKKLGVIAKAIIS